MSDEIVRKEVFIYKSVEYATQAEAEIARRSNLFDKFFKETAPLQLKDSLSEKDAYYLFKRFVLMNADQISKF